MLLERTETIPFIPYGMALTPTKIVTNTMPTVVDPMSQLTCRSALVESAYSLLRNLSISNRDGAPEGADFIEHHFIHVKVG